MKSWITICLVIASFTQTHSQTISRITGHYFTGHSCAGPYGGFAILNCGVNDAANICFDRLGHVLVTGGSSSVPMMYRISESDTFKRYANQNYPLGTINLPAPALDAYIGIQRSAAADRQGNVYATE